MNIFLKIKHWQLFLLLLAPVIIMPFSLRLLPDYFTHIAGIANILSLLIFILWLFTIGNFLYIKRKKAIGNDVKIFRFGLIISFVYLCIFFSPIVFFGTIDIPPAMLPMPYFVYAHFISSGFIFYALYFVAKQLSSLEQGKASGFGDWIGYFLLLWFFPIGIWAIQPKVNKFYKKM